MHCLFLTCAQVTRQIVKPALGEVVVFEYPFTNPFSHEVVSANMASVFSGACSITLTETSLICACWLSLCLNNP